MKFAETVSRVVANYNSYRCFIYTFLTLNPLHLKDFLNTCPGTHSFLCGRHFVSQFTVYISEFQTINFNFVVFFILLNYITLLYLKTI